jgi:hypothetical protein
MFRRRVGALALAGLLAVVSASCGGGDDERVRNIQSIVGQPCTKLGQTKKVQRVLNVCGRQTDSLVWYAAVSRSPKGAKCTRPGGYRVTKGKPTVCATVGKKRMWIEVRALPGSMVGPSTTVAVGSDTTGSPAAASGDARSGVIPSRSIDPSQAESVAKAGSPATQLELVTKPNVSRNGEFVSQAPVVRLVDASGEARAIEGVPVRVVAASAGYTIEGGESVTGPDGSAVFGKLSILGGPGVVEIAFVSDNHVGVTTKINHASGSAVAVRIVERPGSVTAGVTWIDSPAVQLVDVAGAPVQQAGVEMRLTAKLGDSSTSTVAEATTDATGRAVFGGGSVPVEAGKWTMSVASEAGDLASEPFEVAVVAADAARLRTMKTIGDVANGVPLAEAVQVRVTDKFGNPVKRAGLTVNVNAATLVQGGDVAVSPKSGVTDESGIVTFDKFTLEGSAGAAVIGFIPEDVSIGVATANVELVAGPATNIRFAVAPQGVRSGVPFDVSPQIEVTDSSGNRVPVGSGVVTAVVDNGVALVNTTAEFGDDHLAKFAGLTASGTAGDVTLSFTYGSFTVEQTLALQNGPLDSIKIASLPQVVTAGEEFGASVALYDAESNAVLDEDIVMTLKSQAIDMAAISGNSGTIDFGGLTFDVAGETTLRFEVLDGRGTKLLVLTQNIRVVPADVAKVEFLESSAITVRNNEQFPTPVRVRTLDRFGNAANKAGVDVKATVTVGVDLLKSMSSDVVTTDQNGVATFTNLRLTGKTGKYGLSFGVDGGQQVNYPAEITLTAGAPTAFILERGASGFVNNKNATVQPIIQLIDSARNASPTAGVQVSAGFTGKANSIIAETGSDGRAVFAGLKYANVITPRLQIEYLSPGLSALTQPVEVAAGVPTTLTTGLGKGGRITSGTPLGTLAAIDLDGNATSLDSYRIEVAVERTGPDFSNKYLAWSGASGPMSRDGQGRVQSNLSLYGAYGTRADIRITVVGEITLSKSIPVEFSTDPKAGDPGFSGGIIVGELTVPVSSASGISEGGWLLEIAPSDWWTKANVHPLNFVDSVTYSRTGITTSTLLGQGPGNTRSLVNAQQNRPAAYGAALVAGLTVFGLSDWFLPSREELVYIIGQLGNKPAASAWELRSRTFLTSTLAGPSMVWHLKAGVAGTASVGEFGWIMPVRTFG